MAELLKRSFELFVKKRWLKIIDKETDKYNKLKSKLFRQQYVVNALLEEYKKKYSEDLRTPQKEGEWIWDREHSNYKCSLCGEYDTTTPKFCRGCRAKMKGGE